MGRLFWKLFLVILLAQVVTTYAVGALLWLEHPARSGHFEAGFAPPRPGEDRGPMSGPELTPPPPPGEHRLLPPGRPGFPYLPVLVGSFASLLFAALLARHLSRPIMALRRAFTAVGQGNFDVSPSAEIGRRHDELAELGRAFELTAQQLKQLVASQRRLLHDVSHEVRSPLARMQLAIDLARQQPDKTASSMDRIERESARINRLVEELLTLSRLEARACGAMNEEVDLIALVEDIVADARFEAEAHHKRVEFTSKGEFRLKGRTDLLQRAVENVVRNALHHTFEGTTVQVRLRHEKNEIVIEVNDEGSGLPEPALGAIFEPFVRFREGSGNDGYGLGLAITRETLEAHGGGVRAMNREQGGLRIEMRLPDT